MILRKVVAGFGLMACSLLAACSFSWTVKAQTKPWDLDAVLHQMDVSGAKFKSAQADIKKDWYERVVKDTTTQTGTIYYERVGSGIQMGAKFTPPGAKVVEVKDGVVRMFEPNANHLTQISIKNNQAQYESFLTMGFGGSGTDLANHWTITYQGTEQLNDGKKMVPTAKLDMVAKDADTRKLFPHVTLWIDPTMDVSLKQQFFQQSGDIQTATYTNIRYNDLKKSDIDAYAIKTDKKTTVDNH
jgi:hypothetical protein